MTEQIKDWNKVTKEELFNYSFRQNMCDFEIAEIYGVTAQKVAYKRKKFNLKVCAGSEAFKRLSAENTVEVIASTCGMDEEYKQKLLNVIGEYFNK